MVAATVAEVLAMAETAIHGLPGGPPAIAAAIRAVISSSDVARTASMVCLWREGWGVNEWSAQDVTYSARCTPKFRKGVG